MNEPIIIAFVWIALAILSYVLNPSDKVPFYACLVIANIWSVCNYSKKVGS